MILSGEAIFAIYCAMLASTPGVSSSDDITTISPLSSESSENGDHVGAKSLIGTVETVKRVADVLVLVGSKILPENFGSASSREFSRPKMRVVQIVYNVKKDVEDIMKS